MRQEDKQLESFLKDTELIAAAELEKAIAEADRTQDRLVDVLLVKKLLPEADLMKLQAYVAGIPFVALQEWRISDETLRLIPEPIASKNNVIAFRKQGDKLEVAMIDPKDLQTIDFLHKKLHLKILPRYTTPEGIKYALRQYTKSLKAEFGEIIQQEAESITTGALAQQDSKKADAEELKKAAEELPVVRIVDTLIKHAVLQRASDIHIEPLEKAVVVRYRIDGVLHDAMTLPKAINEGLVARIKVLANLKLDEHRLPQDGRFKIETEDFKYSFRVSVLPVFDGEKVVMRLLSESTKALTLEQLGLRGEALERIERAIRKPVGMILVTGPTGSGKTTTLYSLLEILNHPEVNISTVEDPVEYRMPRINQTQVRPDIGLSFANGLRTLMRQDPDIIMVGEIRDKETASLAVNAALTGHLVLSTLHTNSAAGAIPRLIDMGVEPFLISSTLNVIVAQRLVRRLCDEKTAYHLTAKEQATLKKSLNLEHLLTFLQEERVLDTKTTWAEITLSRAKETKDCPEGYKGRVGIYEVLEITESIRTLTNQRASIDHLQEQAVKEGMRTMLEDGIRKCIEGMTSLEEVLRVTSE
ncbi:MAG: hypothetical protein A2806_04670 [Candidatus Terrybacteria bacterium RIFCSPHIGHO2_01_FULL_48_17]|uniref:Bacterial type II secretion system protein E domain-containing protein n=1 Tax=Candidatus Terrybacteria bacterium RIFCSPHIGHO2_01_FULL_48_17 TaxID=1802362 RepID=A0A1G2PKV0_9BACT|nr:MAG: hypothetical protein A2806_04670 [Candidatus Terrybacteria bacterium RIFCSPHIGHO2_01_FULL_48_17]OHA52099.1 MAG: hypothetical protein A3A30_04315 [Candidatus Terrybacteria bacterium RIFCSPLOWO2_01_FULL_48_14]